jgi:transposase
MVNSEAIRKHPSIHLEIQRHRKSPVGILRSSFRDPASGKVMHRQHGRITGVDLDTLRLVQGALRGDVLPMSDPASMRILSTKEFGGSAALLALARDLGLDCMLYSKPNLPWVKDVLAMIVGRILFQGSKLALSQITHSSALWELCGVEGEVDVDEHCYAAMDRLLERQEAIQKSLAKKHLNHGALVLYDITSTYFEGEYEHSELVKFGYNRDGKRGYEQVVIGLLTNAQGCPVAVEVFPGCTKDASTVERKVRELRERYGVKQVVMVGDRGMITQSTEEKLQAMADADQLRIISALTHRELVQLLERNGHQPELFDDREIVEIRDEQEPGKRFCLCRNPQSAARETQTRKELLARTEAELQRISQRKTKAKSETIGAQVGRLLAKTKMGKFIQWSVEEGRLQWSVKSEAVAAEQAFDGCYVIKTTVASSSMTAQEVVKAYKSLGQVEQAFRHMKSVSLEIRPVHHKTDERIKAHVFLCMLAYYVLWHLMERLAPLGAVQSEEIALGQRERKERDVTVANILARLKAIQRCEVAMGETRFRQVSEVDAQQEQILKLLGVKI